MTSYHVYDTRSQRHLTCQIEGVGDGCQYRLGTTDGVVVRDWSPAFDAYSRGLTFYQVMGNVVMTKRDIMVAS